MVQGSIPESDQSGQQAANVLSGARGMRADLRSRWIEALRSGRFHQGVGMMRDDDGRYCCLGVLAKLQGADFDLMSNTTSLLPEKFDCGLESCVQLSLASKNDTGFTFPEIADYIEANIPTTDNSVTSSTDSRDGSLCGEPLLNT